MDGAEPRAKGGAEATDKGADDPAARPFGRTAVAVGPAASPTLGAAQTDSPPAERVLVGILVALVAFLLFAISDAVLKLLSGRYAIYQVNVMQGVVAAVPLVAMLLWRGRWRRVRIRHKALVAVRGLLGGIGGMLGLTAFSRLPLADVYAIIFATPILVTILSIPILGEKVRIYRWSAVVVGFCGVLVMVQPGSAALGLGHLAALACVLVGSCVILIMRGIGREEDRVVMVSSVVLGLLLVNAVPAAVHWSSPRLADLGLAAASGSAMLAAQFLMIQALRLAPAGAVSPMQYSMMVWALLLGVFVFGDAVRLPVVLGALIVTGSSLYIMHRERVRAAEG